MIIVNGVRKSGTHALLRSVDLFAETSIQQVRHSHIPYALRRKIKGFSHIHIWRNPRNILVSRARSLTKEKPREQDLLHLIPIVLNELRSHLNWYYSKSCYNVRFEELLSDPDVIKNLADFLGFKLIEDHFLKIWGRTRTSTFELSNWKDHWTSSIEQQWLVNGGYSIEAYIGCDPHLVYRRKSCG